MCNDKWQMLNVGLLWLLNNSIKEESETQHVEPRFHQNCVLLKLYDLDILHCIRTLEG
jgi:hypothetical protein